MPLYIQQMDNNSLLTGMLERLISTVKESVLSGASIILGELVGIGKCLVFDLAYSMLLELISSDYNEDDSNQPLLHVA